MEAISRWRFLPWSCLNCRNRNREFVTRCKRGGLAVCSSYLFMDTLESRYARFSNKSQFKKIVRYTRITAHFICQSNFVMTFENDDCPGTRSVLPLPTVMRISRAALSRSITVHDEITVITMPAVYTRDAYHAPIART